MEELGIVSGQQYGVFEWILHLVVCAVWATLIPLGVEEGVQRHVDGAVSRLLIPKILNPHEPHAHIVHFDLTDDKILVLVLPIGHARRLIQLVRSDGVGVVFKELNILTGIEPIVLGVQRDLDLQLLIAVLVVGEKIALDIGGPVPELVDEVHHLSLIELALL